MTARTLDAAARARLRQRFAAIPERMKATARKEVEAEAKAMAEEMKRGAPRDDGDLQASIEATDVSDESWIRWRVTAGGEKTRRQARTTGKGSAPFFDYANGIEYGHMGRGGKKVEATPFFWPVKRRRSKRFRARLMRELKRAAQEPSSGG